MGIEKLNEKTPIVLQYFGDISVRHLGGIAVFPNEFNRVLMEIEASNPLTANLHAGLKLVKGFESPVMEKVWKIFFGVLKRISNSPFSLFSFFVYKRLENYLNKIFRKYDPKRPTVIYHHMNNFVFPDYRVIRMVKKFNVVMVTSIVDLLEVDFPEFLPTSTKVHRRFLKNWLSKSTDYFLPITNFIEKDARSVGLIPKYSNVEVVKWGTDHIKRHESSDEFTRANLKNGHKDALPEPFFLFPAKAWGHKGHKELIKAFCAIEDVDFRIVMIGDLEPLRVELDFLLGNSTGGNGQNIELIGFVDDKTKQKLFEDCKAVILPSCYEGFGFPYFEAAFLSKPLVAFKTKAYLEFFGSVDTKFAVTNQDFDAFIQSLAEFDVNLAEIEAIRKFRLIEHLTWSECVGRTLNIYNTLLKNRF
jgi:glycosyltransferase involved in cell wall biosynthesis